MRPTGLILWRASKMERPLGRGSFIALEVVQLTGTTPSFCSMPARGRRKRAVKVRDIMRIQSVLFYSEHAAPDVRCARGRALTHFQLPVGAEVERLVVMRPGGARVVAVPVQGSLPGHEFGLHGTVARRQRKGIRRLVEGSIRGMDKLRAAENHADVSRQRAQGRRWVARSRPPSQGRSTLRRGARVSYLNASLNLCL